MQTLDVEFSSDFYGVRHYDISLSGDCWNIKIMINIDYRVFRLSGGENIVKIYPNVVLEFDFKLSVVFLLVFSIAL